MPLLGEFHHGGLSNIDRRQFQARMRIRLADISRNLHRKRSGLPWKVLYFATECFLDGVPIEQGV